jgi:hypothetical protein
LNIADTPSDKETAEATAYVDIKSPGLRDILRAVLKDIRTVDVGADKPAVLSRSPHLKHP